MWGATVVSTRAHTLRCNFNPRAPCGARHRPSTFRTCRLHFNPRAPCGARPYVTTLSPTGTYNFNPRAPCGARQTLMNDHYKRVVISIHAPRVGRDRLFHRARLLGLAFQSTRPVWGATILFALGCFSHSDFNPRAPCGARPAPGALRRRSRTISIHAPRVGRDPRHLFQPTSDGKISIHAPRVGRDLNALVDLGIKDVISIHAPRVGRDLLSATVALWRHNFNPRAPCGARRI